MTHSESARNRRERAKHMATLVLQGKSRKEVGQLCGVSRQRVQQLLKEVRVM